MAADAIIVGGGSGARFGRKKQFISLGGIPLIKRTVTAFDTHPSIGRIIVVVPRDDLEHAYSILNASRKPLQVVEGGRTRQESVRNGLECARQSEIVLIHDAVRPFVSRELISGVLDGIQGYDACIPGLAVSNTLKEVENGIVTKTVPRSGLYEVQTPQCFRTAVIVSAHESALSTGNQAATDDSSLIEGAGGRVRLIEGDPSNIKITLEQDIILAEAILRCRSESE